MQGHPEAKLRAEPAAGARPGALPAPRMPQRWGCRRAPRKRYRASAGGAGGPQPRSRSSHHPPERTQRPRGSAAPAPPLPLDPKCRRRPALRASHRRGRSALPAAPRRTRCRLPRTSLTSPPANRGPAQRAAPRPHWSGVCGVTLGPAPLRRAAHAGWGRRRPRPSPAARGRGLRVTWRRLHMRRAGAVYHLIRLVN